MLLRCLRDGLPLKLGLAPEGQRPAYMADMALLFKAHRKWFGRCAVCYCSVLQHTFIIDEVPVLLAHRSGRP